MKTHRHFVIALFALSILMGCGMEPQYELEHPQDQFARAEQAADDAQRRGTTVSATSQSASEPKPNSVKEAQLGFRVDDYGSSMTKARQHIEANGAFVSMENERHQEYMVQNTLRIRVPNSRFNVLLDSLQALAAMPEYRTVTVTDVTVELYQLGSKIDVSESKEGRMTHLIDDMRSVDGKLRVEAKAVAARAEADAAIGKNYHIEEAIAYSTITVVIKQVIALPDAPGPLAGVSKEWLEAFTSGLAGVIGFLVGVTAFWPLWVLLLGALYATRNRWKPLLKRQTSVEVNS